MYNLGGYHLHMETHHRLRKGNQVPSDSFLPLHIPSRPSSSRPLSVPGGVTPNSPDICEKVSTIPIMHARCMRPR